MAENFQANIGAKIKDFMNKMREVDKKVRETAMEANKPIGANISEFMRKAAEVQSEAKRVLKRSEKTIGADISAFMRKAAEVAVVARTLSRERIIVPITSSWVNYQNTMSRIANFSRSIGEVMQMTSRGIGITLSPALVPVIASLAGLIGNLGPMIGTLAGSTFALGSAFATAGVGAAAFGALAVSNLKAVFGASSDLKKLQEKLALANGDKERNKILEKMTRIQSSLNDEQTKALSAMSKLKSVWSGIANSLQSETITIYTKALSIFGATLTALKPMFSVVTSAVDRLMDSLSVSIKSESVQAFFNYLNTSAGPMLETITKSIGNFAKGIMSMMVAFGPLAESTSNGFLDMSESFAQWAAGLGESTKFQSFVNYVKENMPKIRSIFSDAFQGIINVFAAFAPSSSDMMTSLQNMMERFKEWSSTLSTNKGFQNFIDYVQANGPVVVSAIGNIVGAIVNIGIALAPMGEKVLTLANAVIEWTNAMIENHPIIGKIGAAVLVMSGILLAIAPNIIALGTLFSGSATAVMTATSLMRAKFVTGMGMMVKSMLQTSAKMVVTSAQFVAKWTLIGAQSLIHAAKVAAAWTLATGKAMEKAIASMIVTSAQFVAKWVLMGVQALLQAGRMAAAWLIAMGPIGWVTAAIIGLAILIIANWDKIKAKTIEIWNKVSNAVKDAWEKVKTKTIEAVLELGKQIAKMPSKVREFVGDMISAGAALIDGVIKGITGKIGEGLAAIGGFAKGLLNRFKKDTDTHSPSRAFEDISKWFAPGVVNGIDKTSYLAINSVSDFANKLTDAFAPQLAMPSLSGITMNPLDTHSQMDSLKRQIKQELSVDMLVNHKGQSGMNNATGGAKAGPIYVTIDAKNVKEFNDVVKLFDQQAWNAN
ncbi:phage tail protein [Paenisporosarcina cavernae]|uniref:Phage tail tape measure protein n=1 Tax=Paenisporosarcina cavernae TaxID=2320858 RepID=A0A385YSR8_9BACL|nr:hypothetical protein [Paenisporosarcina cavernae]AYC28728.1 hypothetical protein D3873_02135 [Paenisporosarcina cavernae]